MTIPRVILVLLVLLAPARVVAWGPPSHQAIAQAAQAQLTPAAGAALATILQGTGPLSPGALAAVATWPDDVRNRAQHNTTPDTWTQADIAEADQFNAHHPSNAQWHFVDLPLGAGGYPATEPSPTDPLRPFVGNADVVHAIGQCIAILEGSATPVNFSKPQAVRWLVHLVGDMHQPMHVYCYHARRFGDLATAIAALPEPTLILDGEVAIFDERLISRFEWLRHGARDGLATPPIYMVFDAIQVGTGDLRSEPLHARRKILESLVEGQRLLLPARRLAGSGLEAWVEVERRGYEGLVARGTLGRLAFPATVMTASLPRRGRPPTERVLLA